MGGPIIHLEFKSADFERTTAFYQRLFDWRTERNASGSYMKLDGSDGLSTGWIRADLVQAPAPVAYLTVDDLPAKLAEVESAGGRVLVRSLPFAGGGEVALIADPDGNVLGLWRRKVVAAAVPAPVVAAAPEATPTPLETKPVAAKVVPKAAAAKSAAAKPAAPKKPKKK
jgi:uncharacterized protein